MKKEAVEKMNRLGTHRQPFLFVIDFDGQHPVIEPLPLQHRQILFDIKGVKETGPVVALPAEPVFKPAALDFERYENAFYQVKAHLHKGDSYLVNLTQPCPVFSNCSLLQLFHLARAPYKLLFEDRFVVFSPETFIRITERKISSFPMKGTIDARLPKAKSKLLRDIKEKAEHVTMVDLIRNDLSRFAKKVEVVRSCYLDLIKTNNGALWQMSSEIQGYLPVDYYQQIGDILFSMLPAGSVSGAPKKKTIEIIKETEQYDRGYYTGVFGYFDGTNMDSAVMIRFVEKEKGILTYKSGGGVTTRSQLQAEYNELIKKIYVPID